MCVRRSCLLEVEKMLKFVMLNGSRNRIGEMLIVQLEYLIWLQLCTTEANRRNKYSKEVEL